jgi:flagellar basal body P-ring protein FlgI
VKKRTKLSLPIAAALLAALAVGCVTQPESLTTPQPYVDQGYKPGLAPFMRGTVYERTDMGNTQLYPVTGYSLVVNLQNTGDNSAIPTAVRAALIKRMELSGFGQHNDPRFTNLQPEQILRDPRVAVVQVIGLLPVGARRGQLFDVTVRAMPRSRTTSLTHGHLYNTELRNRGLEQPGGGGEILAYADAGDVFVNPVYALETPGPDVLPPPDAPRNYDSSQAVASLRTGTVLAGGRVTEDRPVFLNLRVPQASIARAIERRVNNRFPQQDGDRAAAAAQDEGLVYLYVPYSFQGDWRHFTEVVNHLYVNDSPDYAARRTHELMEEAVKPNAELTDISYCLEGLGPAATPMYESLMYDSDPAVVYAAARAAVFCGDAAALEKLETIATDARHPYQLAAVRTLGELPQSPAVDRRLEPLLASDQALVRIEAYKILAAHGDIRVITRTLPSGFKLDIVDSGGTPMVFATRTGEPRLAVFGPITVSLAPPVIFSAMDSRFTLSTDDVGGNVTLYYRDPRRIEPVRMRSGPTMVELISRLGGMALPEEEHLEMSYAEAVAIVQGLVDAHAVFGTDDNGKSIQAPFVLDQPTELTEAIVNSALDQRPQADPGASGDEDAERPPTRIPPGDGQPGGRCGKRSVVWRRNRNSAAPSGSQVPLAFRAEFW